MAKIGTLTLDGFTVRAEVVAPGVLRIHAPRALQINGDEIPELCKSQRLEAMRGDKVFFTSRRAVIQNLLGD